MDVKNKSKNKDVFIVDFSKTVSISAPAIFSGVDRSDQIRQVHINSHAYTCIHQRIQLAVGDMTMSGWKPTISLIHPPHPTLHYPALPCPPLPYYTLPYPNLT